VKRFARTLGVLCVVLQALRASAEPRDQAAAEALFRAGRSAATAGDASLACARFQESYRLDPTPGTLLNIAICEEQLGQLASAWQSYQGVLDALPGSDERVAIATQHVSQLEHRLPWLTIHLSADAPAGTRVRHGPVLLTGASFDVPLPVDPGRHEVVIAAPGRATRQIVFAMREGERKLLNLEPGAPASERTTEPADKGRQAAIARRRSLAYILLGGGAAGLTGGTVSTVLAVRRAATVREHCTSKVCDDAGLEAASQGQRFQAIAVYAFALGVAGIGSGAYLLLTTPKIEAPVGIRFGVGLNANGVLFDGKF
jgi:tetratricopeptide (TPR) repeat protein